MSCDISKQKSLNGYCQPQALKAPPDLQAHVTMCTSSYHKRTSKFRKVRGKKPQHSGYKQCYTYKNQSLEVSKYMNLALVTCNKLDPMGVKLPPLVRLCIMNNNFTG